MRTLDTLFIISWSLIVTARLPGNQQRLQLLIDLLCLLLGREANTYAAQNVKLLKKNKKQWANFNCRWKTTQSGRGRAPCVQTGSCFSHYQDLNRRAKPCLRCLRILLSTNDWTASNHMRVIDPFSYSRIQIRLQTKQPAFFLNVCLFLCNGGYPVPVSCSVFRKLL